jgi:hypothetical protein
MQALDFADRIPQCGVDIGRRLSPRQTLLQAINDILCGDCGMVAMGDGYTLLHDHPPEGQEKQDG